MSSNTQQHPSNGKVALITGAARRIGAATAKHLHSLGYKVVIHYARSQREAEDLVNELNGVRINSAKAVQGDLLELANIQKISAEAQSAFGRIDLLVNNASTFYPTPISAAKESDWDDLMGSNLKAPLFLSQALLEPLTASKGCIINLIDIHGSKPLADHPIYCAAKAGLKMLTLSMAKDLGPEIRVNGVAPGPILWPEQEAVITESQQQTIIQETALKRSGRPEDIAEAIAYLAGAQYATGQILAIDGGRSLT